MIHNKSFIETGLVPLIGGLPIYGTQGKIIHVKPYTGSDNGTGGKKDPVKTLSKALSLATADQNDIVLFYAESNTSTYTTDYLSSVLDWNKDAVHLIGVNPGNMFSQRSRVAHISTWTAHTDLITWSADGCLCTNMSFFSGVAETGVTGCMTVTGDRNHFLNCQIAGIGNDANDIAGAYSLSLTTAHENLFERCVIGCDTIGRGSASNWEIQCVGGAGGADGCARNVFKDCYIVGLCASAGNYVFLKIASANYIDRFILFDNCVFHNPGAASAGAAMTSAFSVHANAGGTVILHNTSITGANDVNSAADIGIIYSNHAIPAATDAGLTIATTKT